MRIIFSGKCSVDDAIELLGYLDPSAEISVTVSGEMAKYKPIAEMYHPGDTVKPGMVGRDRDGDAIEVESVNQYTDSAGQQRAQAVCRSCHGHMVIVEGRDFDRTFGFE